MVDNKLNWKLQIKSICSKLSSVCGVISKVRHYLDRKALMLIYNSLFDSRLRYAVLGWGTASNQEISNSGSYRTELSDLLISLLFEPLWPRSILILRYSPLIKFSFFKKMSICTTYTTIIYRLRLVHIVTNQRIGIWLGIRHNTPFPHFFCPPRKNKKKLISLFFDSLAKTFFFPFFFLTWYDFWP